MPGESGPRTAGIEDTLALGSASTAAPESEATRRIGQYRLLQLIGEGGMGEVWLAEQVEPVRRRVAIKVIKAGMDTKQVVARFESSARPGTLMDHPAIAKVFDGEARQRAGRTSSWSTLRAFPSPSTAIPTGWTPSGG